MHTFSKRSNRRGASAVEFALIMPVLIALVMGLVDYGWFFTVQGQTMSALSSSMNAGAHLNPTESDGDGRCDSCVETAAGHAAIALQNLGHRVTSADLTPQIERISGTCALTLTVHLDHQSIVGLVPVPHGYTLSVNALLLHVEDC